MARENHEEYPCEDHKNELEAIRAIANHADTEIKVMQTMVNMLSKSLFGNGQPGVIQKMEEKMESWEKRLSRQERITYAVMVAFALVKFLTENGALSLKALMGGK